jgi:hypothetical protein
LHGELALQTLRRSVESRNPLLILGTAFLFVHLLDYLNEIDVRFKLPPGSHVLETGGYKGRSRTLPKDELHQLICERLGITSADIICEYGMSELSSQAYDNNLEGNVSSNPASQNYDPNGIASSNRGSPSYNPEGIESFSPGSRGTSYPGSEASNLYNPERVAPNARSSTATHLFHFPPWARVQIISPESGHEVNEGETGLIRVFDLANVFSVMAIQTEDIAVRRGSGFELIERASIAEPRGCSLMAV